MAQQRSIEIKVGIFVVTCIVLIAGLIWKLGKYHPLAGDTFELSVVFPNVAGIVKDATVLYSGIPVGKVRGISLDRGVVQRVRVNLGIYAAYRDTIRKDAAFVINQSGLLGDRYVDVVPKGNEAPFLKPGDVVEGSTSVDLSEAIRSVVEVLKQAGGTIERVDKAIKRIDETILSQQRLDHIANSMANIDLMTSNTVELTLSLRNVVEDNRAKVSGAVTSFADAADSLNGAAGGIQDLVEDNAANIAATSRNLAESTQRLNSILARLEKGEGTAGKMLVDPALYNELVALSKQMQKYGLFYNTWFGPKAKKAEESKPATKKDTAPAGDSSKKGQPAIQFGTDLTKP